MAKKPVEVYSCAECGHQSPKWLGRCAECNAWNSYALEAATRSGPVVSAPVPVSILSIEEESAPRISTGLPGFDRVLGGGLVAGGVTLVGGEPGIGKSTLLLQAARELARQGVVLYVSGEESVTQIAMRGRRLRTLDEQIRLVAETSVERIVTMVENSHPIALIVDSIQTMQTTANGGAAGSIGQVRDSAGSLLAAAKRLSVPLILIGHITKEGTIAGPKTLEHIVDTVLYFEGERFQNYRVVRAYKNRYGPVNEVALFEMHDSGLEEVVNPSAALLSQRSGAAGSAILAAMEGTRPILMEVQALVSPTHFPSPRRMAAGLDANRLSLLLAVLERKGGSSLISQDVYVNLAGGLQVDEPALDLALISAVLSSQRNVALPPDLAMFGEVGLLGEIRSVSQPDLRAREAASLGFRRLLLPFANAASVRSDIELLPVRRIEEIESFLFPRRP